MQILNNREESGKLDHLEIEDTAIFLDTPELLSKKEYKSELHWSKEINTREGIFA